MSPTVDGDQTPTTQPDSEPAMDAMAKRMKKIASYKQLQNNDRIMSSSTKPFIDITLPNDPQFRAVIPQIYEDFDQVNAECEVLYETSGLSNDKAAVDSFVQQTQDLGERKSTLIKRARAASLNAESMKDIPGAKRRAIRSYMDEQETKLFRYRATLASGKRRLSGDMLSQTPVSRCAEAFLDHFLLNDKIEWIAGAGISKEDFMTMHETRSRDSSMQTNFKNRLLHAYSDIDKRIEAQDGKMVRAAWCPVVGEWLPKELTTAAHIAPRSIGEYDYALLIGHDAPQGDDVWEAMWSAENGIIVHEAIERALDRGSVVIVPDGETDSIPDYKLVVLLKSVRRTMLTGMHYFDEVTRKAKCKTIGDLDGKKLTWHTAARPASTNLYIRYVLTRLARKRLLASEWELDLERVPRDTAWAGLKALRCRVLRILAEEMGDFVVDENIKSAEGRTEFEQSMALRIAARTSSYEIDIE